VRGECPPGREDRHDGEVGAGEVDVPHGGDEGGVGLSTDDLVSGELSKPDDGHGHRADEQPRDDPGYLIAAQCGSGQHQRERSDKGEPAVGAAPPTEQAGGQRRPAEQHRQGGPDH